VVAVGARLGSVTTAYVAVTVLIPTYNRSRYVGHAIRSVLQQTFRDLELLVLDDGSTDDTEEVVRAIDDPRVRYVRCPHRGISATLNTGVRLARGRYVARLDSDDEWLPDSLARETAVLNEQLDVGLVYGRAQAMDAAGRPLPSTRGYALRYPADSFRSMLVDDSTNISVLVRRECFDRVGLFDESLTAHEDWDMWLRVARHYRFAFVDAILARFRVHGANLTAPASPVFAQLLETRSRVLDKAFGDPYLPRVYRSVKPLAYRTLLLGNALAWWKLRQWRRAGGALGQAYRQGGNPLATTAHVLWLAIFRVIGAYRWAQRLRQWQADLRRRWRARATGDGPG
jgi:glycosyltransferase involved in cell wall biosynthesis